MAYTAIIVEPRRHAALEFVLKNFFENLSDEWNIIVFHGIENVEYVANIANKIEKSKKRITLHNLGIRNLTIPEYNRLFASRSFYNNIPTETFLVFQTDTMIFSKNKEALHHFFKYDYVGAPWPSAIHGTRVGNGGLSLRKKSMMLHIIDSRPYRGEPEDVYFCSNPLYMPTVEEAMRFSVEQIFYPASFGCHKPWGREWGTSLIMIYPELAQLYRLNGVAIPQELRLKHTNSPNNLCLGTLKVMHNKNIVPPKKITQNKIIKNISPVTKLHLNIKPKQATATKPVTTTTLNLITTPVTAPTQTTSPATNLKAASKPVTMPMPKQNPAPATIQKSVTTPNPLRNLLTVIRKRD